MVLRRAQWKANGLQRHREEVKLFLNQNHIDILLICETYFTSKNHFTIPVYELCYTNHQDGTAHLAPRYSYRLQLYIMDN